MHLMPMFFVKICAEKAVIVGVKEIACSVYPYIVLHVTVLTVARYMEGIYYLPRLRRKMLVISLTQCRFLSPTPYPAV
jgi:hypothetical protein